MCVCVYGHVGNMLPAYKQNSFYFFSLFVVCHVLSAFLLHSSGVSMLMALHFYSIISQCVLTSSADGTIKLWAIEDFTCIKTFEGHTNSVLKAIFLSRGMQIASR